MATDSKIVEAFAEWDDPDAFRVFLVREVDGEDGIERDDGTPMEAVYTGDSVEQRLFFAAMGACPKDFVGRDAGREIGWPKEAPAKRVAKAVNAELKRIEKGDPPPDPHAVSMGLQIAKIMKGGRR
jgi:hypothetical protein